MTQLTLSSASTYRISWFNFLAHCSPVGWALLLLCYTDEKIEVQGSQAAGPSSELAVEQRQNQGP